MYYITPATFISLSVYVYISSFYYLFVFSKSFSGCNSLQVFLAEYTGPLLAYLLFYLRPSLVYGAAADKPIESVVQ